MRKKSYYLNLQPILIVLLVLLFSGCTEEMVELDTPTNQSTEKGTLKFADYGEFSAKAAELNNMPTEQLKNWCSENGVITQELLFRSVNIQEELHEQQVVNVLGKDIELDDLLSRDIDPHSDLYYTMLERGVIVELTEDDGSTSYKARIFNPVYMSVLNEEGLVIINNELYSFNESGYKVIHDCDFKKISLLADICETNQELGISVHSYELSNKKGYGHSFNHYSLRYESSRKRVSFQAYFHAGDEGVYYPPSPGTCMGPEFFVEAIALKKNIWGNWVYKNNYTPIDKVSAVWNHYYRIMTDGLPPQYQTVTVSYPKTSPWTYDTFSGMGGTTNHLKVNCNPGGYWYCPPSGWMIDECNVYNYSFFLKAINYSDLTFSD